MSRKFTVVKLLLWLGFSTTSGIALKGHIIWKVENYCSGETKPTEWIPPLCFSEVYTNKGDIKQIRMVNKLWSSWSNNGCVTLEGLRILWFSPQDRIFCGIWFWLCKGVLHLFHLFLLPLLVMPGCIAFVCLNKINLGFGGLVSN